MTDRQHDNTKSIYLLMLLVPLFWGGAFGTWFWIDPTNDLVFVGMIQNLRGSIPGAGTPALREISPRLVYEALTTD